MTTVTVSGFKIRKGERLYGTYVRYALYKATIVMLAVYCFLTISQCLLLQRELLQLNDKNMFAIS